MPNAGSHLNIVSEDDELLRPASPMAPSPQDRPISAQTFGHDALPLPVETRSNKTSSRQSRNSLATLINALDQELRMPLPPPSAASEVTLFDLEHGDFDPEADGPLASSTPHESQRTKPKSKSRDIPPVPQIRDAQAVKASRRSSIRYIVSDENAPASPVVEVARSGSSGSTKSVVAQWGARAIRPLVPKSPKSKGKKKANGDAANGDAQVNGLGEPEVATPQPMTPPVQPAVSLVLTASPETPAPTQSLVVSDTILGMFLKCS